jgi:hypothetical protein
VTASDLLIGGFLISPNHARVMSGLAMICRINAR